MFEGSKVLALDIPARNIRPIGNQLLSYARTNGDTYLAFEQHSLPLKHVMEKDLKDFLNGPERVVFVKTDKIRKGIALCLENAISLTLSSDKLTPVQSRHAMFLTFTALEELGKAAILADNLRLAASAQFVRIDGFRNHTTKFLRAIEGLAGVVMKTGKHAAQIKGGALRKLNLTARTYVGHNGALAFRFLYVDMHRNFELLRDMGEFFRSTSLYLEYHGRETSWVEPWTRFSQAEITDLNETIREYSEEYKRRLSDGKHVPTLEEILPVRWFDKLADRWPPKNGIQKASEVGILSLGGRVKHVLKSIGHYGRP